MKNEADLLQLYTSILKAAGCVVDEQGNVSKNLKIFNSTADNTPVVIKGKRLVLPTPEHLQNALNSTTLKFHPLYENIMRDETETIKNLRDHINNRLSTTLTLIVVSLLNIAASVKEHHKLNPDQSEYLSLVKNANEAIIEKWTKYINGLVKQDHKNFLINIYLKKGGMLDKKRYTQTGIVSFPAYTEIFNSNKDTAVHGVKFTAKERETLINLFEYILPNIGVENYYSVGVHQGEAPRSQTLLTAFANIATKFNDILELFGSNIDSYKELIINLDWTDAINDLSAWKPAIRSIPMQDEGRDRHQNAPQIPSTLTPVPAPQQIQSVQQSTPSPAPAPQQPFVAVTQQPSQSQPVQQTQSNEVVTSGGLDMSKLMERNMYRNPQLAPLPPPVAFQAPAVSYQMPVQVPSGGYPQQPQQQMQPGYPVPQQQMPMQYNQPMPQQQMQYPQQMPMNQGYPQQPQYYQPPPQYAPQPVVQYAPGGRAPMPNNGYPQQYPQQQMPMNQGYPMPQQQMPMQYNQQPQMQQPNQPQSLMPTGWRN